jgi:hypothetical protein
VLQGPIETISFSRGWKLARGIGKKGFQRITCAPDNQDLGVWYAVPDFGDKMEFLVKRGSP